MVTDFGSPNADWSAWSIDKSSAGKKLTYSCPAAFGTPDALT